MITLTTGETRRLTKVNDSYVIPHHQHIDSIEKVDVSYAFFRTDKAIDDFVNSLPQVTSLSMKDVKFGCDCGKIHNLRNLPNASNSQMCRHKLTKEHLERVFSMSTHLSLEHTCLALRFPHEFNRFESLATNTTLKSLDLSRNRMSIPGYNFLMTVLDSNTTLTTLSIGESVTRHLAHKDSIRFPDPFSFAVDRTLLPFRNITHIDLSGNHVLTMRNGSTRSHIVDIISNPKLLSFKYNDPYGALLGEMTMILKSLAGNKTLEVFEMSESSFKLEDLKDIFLENDTLRTLNLGDNGYYDVRIPKSMIMSTCVAAIANKTLTTLKFLSYYDDSTDMMKHNLSSRNLTLYDHLIRHCSQFNFNEKTSKRQRLK